MMFESRNTMLTVLFTLSLTSIWASDNNFSRISSDYTSTQLPIREEEQRMFKAFWHLNQAIDLAQNIPSEDVRLAACNALQECKDQFLNSYAIISEKLETLNENIDEILCDCGDDRLRVEISQHVNAMATETDQETLCPDL